MKSTLTLLFVFIPALAFGGELEDLFREEWKNRSERKESKKSQEDKVGPSRSDVDVKSGKHGITEIGLERIKEGVHAYIVIIKSDGTFRYTGHVYFIKYGKHTGTIRKEELRAVLHLINDSKYDSYQPRYAAPLRSGYEDIVYTMVKMNGNVKVISNSEKNGPTELQAIEQAIDDLLLNAKWDHKVTREEKLDKLRQLAKGGDNRAAAILSYRYLTGFDVVRDVQRAFSYAKTSAEKKDPLGIYCLSHCYREGLGIPKDKNKAKELVQLALPGLEAEVKSGDAWAQFALGKIYVVSTDHSLGMNWNEAKVKAIELFTKSAEQGNAAAMAELGFCYQHGWGVPESEAKAAEFYAEAAELGNAMAQRHLGYLHKLGQGVSRSKARTVELYTKAAELGDGPAQVMLAHLYLHGEGGVPKNKARAAELYARAAGQDGILQGSAQQYLANLYAAGTGVLKNEAKAIELYAKAGENGQEGGYLKIGWIYLSKKDSKRAIEFFDKLRPSIFRYMDNAERDEITTLYNDSGLMSPWVRAAVAKVKDPDSGVDGGPSTKEVMEALGRREMNILFLDQHPETPKREIKRDKPMKSDGGGSIPVGVTIYPIRLKVPIIVNGFFNGNRPTEEKVYYFFKNESEDWVVREKPK